VSANSGQFLVRGPGRRTTRARIRRRSAPTRPVWPGGDGIRNHKPHRQPCQLGRHRLPPKRTLPVRANPMPSKETVPLHSEPSRRAFRRPLPSTTCRVNPALPVSPSCCRSRSRHFAWLRAVPPAPMKSQRSRSQSWHRFRPGSAQNSICAPLGLRWGTRRLQTLRRRLALVPIRYDGWAHIRPRS
jgi:hypothetical protein